MSARRDPGPQDGFTLLELLVVMVVVGILAGVSTGALLGQRRKAQETSTKSDLRAIVKEVQTFYVDELGSLDLAWDATSSTWRLLSGATLIADGKLSDGNSISTSTSIDSVSAFCIAIVSQDADARRYRATPSGLELGGC